MQTLSQQMANFDLCERYATDTPDFIWFDWGKDFAAWVPSEGLVIWHRNSYKPPSFIEAVDWIAERIREDL